MNISELFSFIFGYIAHNPFVFLFLSIAIGYPLGKISIKGINLGSTAGTLVVESVSRSRHSQFMV